MNLTKYLRGAGYDLIEGPVRNHQPLQLWLKRGFDQPELYYQHIDHAFAAPTALDLREDPALSVDSTYQLEHSFHVGLTIVGEILASIGAPRIDLSAELGIGRKVKIGYKDSMTRAVPLGELTSYLSEADFLHVNPVLLKHLHRNNMFILSGIVFAQKLEVSIEAENEFDTKAIAKLSKLKDPSLEVKLEGKSVVKMEASGNGLFPIAVKANRIDFDKGEFKGLHLVTDSRNLF
ncbi:MAG: hypothetical protein RIQ50_970 [Bacteroidota bacterium]|jgi:hypothetical protein